ncbi:MAG: TetR/AcrR family transcriptional regulator [Clostridia bacterium]|nr:TetR/AcrR family transcriptional regulator [Clostridia bacterium]
MYKLCKTESATKRQRDIEECFLTLLKQKNYEDITVTELCEKMKMPRKAFYRYFDSKEDALYALIDHKMLEYDAYTNNKSNTPRSLTSELEDYFKYWMGKRELLSALDKSSLLGIFIDRSVNFPIGDRVSISKFLPAEKDEVGHKILKFAFVGLCYTMIEWYRSDFNTPPREMAKLACRMLRVPLFPSLSDIGFVD